MIKRYTRREMKQVWENKYHRWIGSLLAVCYARVKAGEIPEKTFNLIKDNVSFDQERFEELDGKLKHDAQALIETARESLLSAGIDKGTVALLGAKVTSYDMEDPAFSLMIIDALELILKELDSLVVALIKKAKPFTRTPCTLLTHGQAAVPGYLALRFCRWIAMLERDRLRLVRSKEDIEVAKFSGPGGIYDELDPQLEIDAANYLGLHPDKCASQIIHRDRHASAMVNLAVCASNISQISNDLWEMCSYPRSEAREYFSPTQRGSTAMPYKKNPINLEKFRLGIPSVIRGYAGVALENVMTWDERAIDQSSAERIIWPDATILLHYMLVEMRGIIEKMIFYPAKMKANLDALHSIWGGQYVKNILWDKGIYELDFVADGKTETLLTYVWVQSCCFAAWDVENNVPISPLKDVLISQGILDYLNSEELDRCFDLTWVLRNAHVIYSRFNI